jgi:hypothetical protein
MFVDWRETLAVIQEVDPSLLCLALLILSANMPLSSYKWDLLLRVHDVRPGFFPVLKAYWIGSFFSNYLPSSVGGDLVRLFVLKCEGRRDEIASSILVERITGFLVLLLLSVFALALRPQYFDVPGGISALWLLVAGASVALIGVLLASEPIAWLLVRLPLGRQRLIGKAVNVVARISAAMASYRRAPRSLVVAVALSAPFYGILMIFEYLILDAVGVSLSLVAVAAITPLIPLIAAVPISINGLGVAEGAYFVFFTQAGVAPEAAFAGALLRRLISLVVSLFGGLFWMEMPRRRMAP